MATYVLSPGNPYDFTDEELDDLLTSVRQEVPDADVAVQRRDEFGYGVTLWEVIVVVAAVRGAGGDLVVRALAPPIIKWVRNRWEQDRDKHPDSKPRPRSIVFLDVDRNKFRSITIDLPDGEPRDDEIGDQGGS